MRHRVAGLAAIAFEVYESFRRIGCTLSHEQSLVISNKDYQWYTHNR